MPCRSSARAPEKTGGSALWPILIAILVLAETMQASGVVTRLPGEHPDGGCAGGARGYEVGRPGLAADTRKLNGVEKPGHAA